MMKAQADADRAAAAKLTAQAQAQKVADAGELGRMKQALDEMREQMKVLFDQRTADRQDLDVANRVDVSQREIELAEKAPPETQNAIISPNG